MRYIYIIFIMTFHGINDKLYFDDNLNIGIGITNPSTNFHIDSTDAIVIPVGTTAQRIDVTGAIRYNTTNETFEGFKGTWGSLGGVIDVDQDTYVSAETSAGTDNDELKFVTAGTERMVIDSSGNTTINSDLIVDTNLLYVDSSSDLVNVNGDLDIWGKARFETAASYIESGVLSLSNTLTGPVIDSTGSDIRLSPSDSYVGALVVSSNGKVGIGTDSPDKALHIVSSQDEILRLDNTSGGESYIGYYNTETVSTPSLTIGLNSTESCLINMKDEKAIIFKTNNNEKMRITSDGEIDFNSSDLIDANNVEINGNLVIAGNTDMTSALNITGQVAIGDIDAYIYDEGGSNEIPFALTVKDYIKVDEVDNDAGAIYFGNGVTNGIYVSSEYWNVNFDRAIYSFNGTEGCCVRTRYAQLGLKMGNNTPSIDFAISDVDTGLNSEGTDELAVYTGGSERMRFDSSGNVGIGTDDPTRALDVYAESTGEVAVFKTGHTSSACNITLDTDKTSTGNAGILDFKSQGTSFARIIGNATTAGSTGDLIFQTSGSLTERMRIDSSGNVGIGTNSPAEKLHIYDTTNSTIRIGNNEAGSLEIKSWSSYGTTFTINQDDGNFLTSAGATQIDMNSDFIRFQTATSGTAGNTLTFSERMRIDNAGNVGIGIDVPDALLHLHFDPTESSGLKELLRLSWYDNTYNTIKGDGTKISFHTSDTDNSTSSTEGGYIGVMKGNSTEANAQCDFTIALNDGTDLLEKFRILHNGNIGIGIEDPEQLFHIYQNENDSIQLIIQNDYASSRAGLSIIHDTDIFNLQQNGGAAIIENYGEDGTYFYQKGSTSGYLFKTTDSNTTRVVIDTTGYVGIGTTDPQQLLEIYGSNPGLLMNSGSGGSYIDFFNRDGNNYMNASDRTVLGEIRFMAEESVSGDTGDDYDIAKTFCSIQGRVHTDNGGNSYGALQGGIAIYTNDGDGSSSGTTGNDLTEKITIDYRGYLGIGDTDPSTQLDVVGSINYTGSISDVSDGRFKDNQIVVDYDLCYDKVKQLDLKNYNWNEEIMSGLKMKVQNENGFIAQEVEVLMPDAVHQRNRMNIEDFRVVDYNKINMYLFGAFKKSQNKIEELEISNEILVTKIEELEISNEILVTKNATLQLKYEDLFEKSQEKIIELETKNQTLERNYELLLERIIALENN